ncbi:MAG TPA: hypothetical protein VIJ29_02205 [Candidatus Paceibacterota bacterium]
MKIVFLNTWNGKVQDGISDFIKEQSTDTDVFCLQEVYEEMRLLCKKLLPDYKEVVAYKRIGIENDFPQATYLKKGLHLLSSEIVLDNQPGKANPSDKSSWQSGDHHLPKNERKLWGGAIDAHGLILSFTGAPELGDEAAMLLAAVRMGLLDEGEALEIATISINTVYTSVIRLYPYE